MARRTLKAWQLILLGPLALWIAWDEWHRLDAFEKSGGTIYVGRLTHALYSLGGKNAVFVVFGGVGVFYVWACVRYFQLQREASARIAAAEAPREQPRPRPAPPKEPPPRLGDDPFREPPRAAPIAVVRPPTAPAATPMAPGNTDDGPKILR